MHFMAEPEDKRDNDTVRMWFQAARALLDDRPSLILSFIREVLMLKNMHYDMVEEMAKLSQSLARMDTYVNDSKGWQECAQLWTELKKRQEEELRMLYKEFEKHVKEGIAA
jgi:hypothetical protein